MLKITLINCTNERMSVIDLCISQVTYLHTVPSIVNLLARHPAVERFDLHSLRSCLTGSAPVNDEMIEHAVHRIGVPELTFRQGQLDIT